MPFLESQQADRARAWAHAIDLLKSNDAARRVLDIVLYEATWYVPLRDKQSPFTDFRYWSKGTRDADGVGKLKREHVTTRRMAKERMSSGEREAIRSVLSTMVVCVVTEEEHERLRSFSHLDGWDRYRAAGISVYDRADQRLLW